MEIEIPDIPPEWSLNIYHRQGGSFTVTFRKSQKYGSNDKIVFKVMDSTLPGALQKLKEVMEQ